MLSRREAPPEAGWAAFKKALDQYYEKEANVGTIPPSKYTVVVNGIKVNLGHDLDQFRLRGIPEGCPVDVRNAIEFYGVVGPVAQFLHSAKGSMRSAAQWAAFKKALIQYYENRNNRGKLPAQDYSPVVNGITVNLGKSLHSYKGKGAPKNCPDDIRKLMESYGVLEPHASHAPRRIKSAAQWAAFKKALIQYYANRNNRGKLPAQSYSPVVDGITVNLGLDLRNYKQRGVPKKCPDDIRKLMENFGLVGDPSHQMAAPAAPDAWLSRRAGRESSGFPEDQAVVAPPLDPLPVAGGGFETLYPNSDWEVARPIAPSQSHAMTGDLSTHSPTPTYTVNPVAPFFSPSANTFPSGDIPGTYSNSEIYIPDPAVTDTWNTSGHLDPSSQYDDPTGPLDAPPTSESLPDGDAQQLVPMVVGDGTPYSDGDWTALSQSHAMAGDLSTHSPTPTYTVNPVAPFFSPSTDTFPSGDIPGTYSNSEIYIPDPAEIDAWNTSGHSASSSRASGSGRRTQRPVGNRSKGHRR
ncbi:hypothetical protein [Streptomyces sp. NPDC006012]|uniref:hypothetical protein n=1 Tax=Streptomyces sp. NPDC006012 TaxID=3364739 RepID=UPI00368CDECB